MALRDGNLLVCSYDAGKFAQLSGFSTTIVASAARSEVTGVTIDATKVFTVADNAGDKAYSHTGISATIDASFSLGFGGLGCTTTSDNNFIALRGGAGPKQYSGFSSTITASFSATGYFGITRTFSYTILSASSNGKIIRYNGFGSSVESSLASGGGPGVSWDGTNMYGSDNYTSGNPQRWNKYSGFSTSVLSTVISPFTIKTETYDIEWDNAAQRFASPGPSGIKTVNGLAIASVKTFNGLATGSVKSWNGVT